MTLFLTIFSIPLLIFFFFSGGIISAFVLPFGQVYFGFVMLLTMICYVVWKRYKILLPALIVALGSMGLWISLILSYKKLPPNEVATMYATGGFPLPVFHYPAPVMGSDLVPSEMWGGFYLNFFFWLVCAAIIVLLVRRKMKANLRLSIYLNILSVIISFVGLGYLTMQFD